MPLRYGLPSLSPGKCRSSVAITAKPDTGQRRGIAACLDSPTGPLSRIRRVRPSSLTSPAAKASGAVAAPSGSAAPRDMTAGPAASAHLLQLVDHAGNHREPAVPEF